MGEKAAVLVLKNTGMRSAEDGSTAEIVGYGLSGDHGHSRPRPWRRGVPSGKLLVCSHFFS